METIAKVFQTEIFQRIGWTLVHFVWQATAIGLVLAIVLKLLQRASANLRYVTACAGLVLIVALPTVTLKMVDVQAAKPVEQKIVEKQEAAVEAGPIVEMPMIELPAATIEALPRVSLKDRFTDAVESALPYMVVGWLVGVFGLSLWHLGGFMQLQKLRQADG